MSYLALARKYRPQAFEEVIGQKHIVQTLSNAILQNRIAHAYMFIGPRGVGKTSIARIFAKSLNCAEGPTVTPCGKCNSCTGISEGSSLDIIEIDAASNRKVEEVREILDNVQYLPSQSRYKVYIIDEVHMLSTHAFNALLKILEEPPSHVIFIFATTEPAKIPETIVSRCQRFVFKRMSREEIKAQLKYIIAEEKKKIEPEALDMIADAADGSMRDGQSILDQVIAYSGDSVEASHVEILTGALEESLSRKALPLLSGSDFHGILSLLEECEERGADFQVILSKLSRLVRDMLLFRENGKAEILFHRNDLDYYEGMASSFSPEKLVLINDLLADAAQKLRFLSEKRIFMEFLFYKIIHSETLYASSSEARNTAAPPPRAAAETSSPAPRKNTSSWKESVLELAGEDHSLYPILETARMAVNGKGVLFLGWEDPYFHKQALLREDQIIGLIRKIDAEIPVRMILIEKKKDSRKEKESRQKTEKRDKDIPEEVLEFKNTFNGEIIEQRRKGDV
ncbi:MAG TPA: DNA polymerase III subunit gamma/tau [Candidatus Mcinerneyibacteriales bacterium]|mgnify:FL=1|nr:DNA polymerase III subunit gamma/tau [Candidatus Mcinerneyibacteriales bacterium]